MSFLSLCILAVGLAMDAFAVTVARSISDCHMSKKTGLTMVSLFGLFQGLMPLAGYVVGVGFSNLICKFDHWLAFILLSIIGIKMIIDSFKEEETICVTNFKMMLVLAVATSIDALAVGITFAFLKVDIILASLVIATITFLLCYLALSSANKWKDHLGNKADIIGGVILIGIAIKILIEHLNG